MMLIIVGIYLLTSAIKNRRPIETARAIIAKPSATKSTLASAEGYEAVQTGAPTLTVGGSPQSPDGESPGGGDPSMSIGGPPPAGKKLPGGAEIGLQPNAVRGGRAIYAQFPSIKTMFGRGSRPVGTSDHPKGLAIDFMIPSWNTSSGNAFGWTVARWVAANAKALKVKYIIWDKKKWNPSVNTQWRPYRHPSGVSNANLDHRNHVHVSFLG